MTVSILANLPSCEMNGFNWYFLWNSSENVSLKNMLSWDSVVCTIMGEGGGGASIDANNVLYTHLL